MRDLQSSSSSTSSVMVTNFMKDKETRQKKKGILPTIQKQHL